MIPKGLVDIDLVVTDTIDTTKTYKLSHNKIQGFTNDLQALEQAIYKELNTEMYEYPIYSFSYGIELESLLGKEAIYVQIELKRRIVECLMKDSRILNVDNFIFTVKGDELLCEFNVSSIYGEIDISKGVNI